MDLFLRKFSHICRIIGAHHSLDLVTGYALCLCQLPDSICHDVAWIRSRLAPFLSLGSNQVEDGLIFRGQTKTEFVGIIGNRFRPALCRHTRTLSAIDFKE